jgi:hypothetical protein
MVMARVRTVAGMRRLNIVPPSYVLIPWNCRVRARTKDPEGPRKSMLRLHGRIPRRGCLSTPGDTSWSRSSSNPPIQKEEENEQGKGKPHEDELSRQPGVSPVFQNLLFLIIRYPNRRTGGSLEWLLDHVSLFHEGKADGPPIPNPEGPRTFPRSTGGVPLPPGTLAKKWRASSHRRQARGRLPVDSGREMVNLKEDLSAGSGVPILLPFERRPTCGVRGNPEFLSPTVV